MRESGCGERRLDRSADLGALGDTNVYRCAVRVKGAALRAMDDTWSPSCRWSPARSPHHTLAASCRDHDVSRNDVLILSTDPLAAALLGAAVELVGHQPHFSEPHEAPREALRRVRPRAVLIDADHAEACAEAFIGPALMTGARLLVFDARGDGTRSAALARRAAIEVVRLPDDHEKLFRCLDELAA